MADVHFLFRDRTKRLRAIVELLLLEGGDDEEESRRDGHGNKLRRGGYRPTPQQDPDAHGAMRWRHKWWLSKGARRTTSAAGSPAPWVVKAWRAVR